MGTMSADFQFGEVKLKVSDLARSVSFYEDVVGFKVLKQDGNQAYLTVDGKKILVVLEEVADALVTQPGTASGLYHFAILLPTRQDLGVSLRRLIDKGVPFGQADHWVSEALYISDPDHNGIEIYRDRPRDRWEHDSNGHIRMSTEPLDLKAILEEGANRDWNGLPLGTTIGHVHLHVSDLGKSKEFYIDLLGFDVTATWRGALFAAAGGYHHHLGLNTWAGAGAKMPPSNGTGIRYYSMVMPNHDELAKLLKRLDQAGIPVREHEGASFIQDPSGIEIKLTA